MRGQSHQQHFTLIPFCQKKMCQVLKNKTKAVLHGRDKCLDFVRHAVLKNEFHTEDVYAVLIIYNILT